VKKGQVQGKAAYQQVRDFDLWICYDGEDWMVQQTKRKGTTLGYAHTVGGHVSAPWPNAMQWMEQDGKGSYQEASRVKATLVYSGDEVPLAT